MHIYAFGSICRGDLREGSDIDLLALVDEYSPQLDVDTFSIYSYGRISDLWAEGNPFAWHLFLESRLVFASDDCDFLKSLGSPAKYVNCVRDCQKFYSVFDDARTSLSAGVVSRVFELSTIFLSIRNLATCFSLGTQMTPDFSRHSARHLGSNSIRLAAEVYSVLERARILSTRGKGKNIRASEVDLVVEWLDNVKEWMEDLVSQAFAYDRIQKPNGCPTANSPVGKQ